MKLSKICNDLRLLASGPQAGLGEINLPPRQAGSSIMPGKVNPVIPEVVNEVAFVVAGNDVTMTMAAEAGQLQLNAFEPVMAHVLFEGLQWMTAAMATLRENCVIGHHGQHGAPGRADRVIGRRHHGSDSAYRLCRCIEAGHRSAGNEREHRRPRRVVGLVDSRSGWRAAHARAFDAALIRKAGPKSRTRPTQMGVTSWPRNMLTRSRPRRARDAPLSGRNHSATCWASAGRACPRRCPVRRRTRSARRRRQRTELQAVRQSPSPCSRGGRRSRTRAVDRRGRIN